MHQLHNLSPASGCFKEGLLVVSLAPLRTIHVTLMASIIATQKRSAKQMATDIEKEVLPS